MLWCIIFQVAVLAGVPISHMVLQQMDLHFDDALRS
jgi:hypothetical protein